MTDRGRVLIVGGDGFIGSALVSFFRRANEHLTYTTIQRGLSDRDSLYLDLADSPDKWELPDDVGAVVFSSGITKLDECETNRAYTARVNVDGTCAMARTFIDRGAHVVFLSSNLVFDGSRPYPSHDDPVTPVVEYGRQKALAERNLLNYGPGCVTVLRLTKVLGPRNDLFDRWMTDLKSGGSVRPFSDMFVSPIPVSFVVNMIRLVLDRKATGIFHLSGERDVSYADIAMQACKLLKLETDRVSPCRASQSLNERGVVVTTRTALDTSRLKEEFGICAPEVAWVIEKALLDPKMLAGGLN